MKIRIGRDHNGAPVTINTNERQIIALLGAPGVGKTTTCRHLVREAVIQNGGTCVVVTPRAYEYADLTAFGVHVHNPHRAGRVPSSRRRDLVIVDDADSLTGEALFAAAHVGRTLIAACATVTPLTDRDPELPSACYVLHRGPHLVNAVQGRLDLPHDAIDVYLDRPDSFDVPAHRWAI